MHFGCDMTAPKPHRANPPHAHQPRRTRTNPAARAAAINAPALPSPPLPSPPLTSDPLAVDRKIPETHYVRRVKIPSQVIRPKGKSEKGTSSSALLCPNERCSLVVFEQGCRSARLRLCSCIQYSFEQCPNGD